MIARRSASRRRPRRGNCRNGSTNDSPVATSIASKPHSPQLRYRCRMPLVGQPREPPEKHANWCPRASAPRFPIQYSTYAPAAAGRSCSSHGPVHAGGAAHPQRPEARRLKIADQETTPAASTRLMDLPPPPHPFRPAGSYNSSRTRSTCRIPARATNRSIRSGDQPHLVIVLNGRERQRRPNSAATRS